MPCASHITAIALAQVFLVTVVAKHWMPHKLISDCGSHFTLHFGSKLMSILDFEHDLSLHTIHKQMGKLNIYNVLLNKIFH